MIMPSAMLKIDLITRKSAKDHAKEDVVCRIITFQSYNGEITGPCTEKAKTFVLRIVSQHVFEALMSCAAQSLKEYGILKWATVDGESTGRRRRVSLDLTPGGE